MTEDISVEFSLFVEQGREREAANFYAAAFGAREVDAYNIDGVLAGVEMRFGNLPVWIAGSNPNREKTPSYGGPFFPKAPEPSARFSSSRLATLTVRCNAPLQPGP